MWLSWMIFEGVCFKTLLHASKENVKNNVSQPLQKQVGKLQKYIQALL